MRIRLTAEKTTTKIVTKLVFMKFRIDLDGIWIDQQFCGVIFGFLLFVSCVFFSSSLVDFVELKIEFTSTAGRKRRKNKNALARISDAIRRKQLNMLIKSDRNRKQKSLQNVADNDRNTKDQHVICVFAV